MLRIRGIVSSKELEEIDQLLLGGKYIDGKATAGFAGQTIKANLELSPEDPNGAAASEIVHRAMRQNPEFMGYAMPFKISGILYNQYQEGMRYDNHNDNVVNWGPQIIIRNDLSFTIFLSSPDEYDGGELVANVLGQEVSVKYERGDMIIYPSGLIHRVNEVTRGCRRAAAGFLQSTIPQQDRRDLVNEVRKVRNDLLDADGRSENFKRMEHVLTNLQRMWIQV